MSEDIEAIRIPDSKLARYATDVPREQARSCCSPIL